MSETKKKNKKSKKGKYKPGIVYAGRQFRKDYRKFFWAIDPQTYREIRLKGITSLIPELFFSKRWSHQQISGKSSKGKKKKEKQTGSERGNQVDKEIKRWVSLKKRHRRCRNVKPETFQQFLNGSHSYTCKLVSFLEKKGWEPLHAQYTVGCLRSKVATDIDLVVEDTTKKQIYLLEIKCGYNGVWNRKWEESDDGEEVMKVKLPGLRHCWANARFYAMTELIWGWMLYNHSNPARKATNAYVIHVHDKPVPNDHPIDADLAEKIIPHLTQFMKSRRQ